MPSEKEISWLNGDVMLPQIREINSGGHGSSETEAIKLDRFFGPLSQALSKGVVLYNPDGVLIYRSETATKHFNIPETVTALGASFDTLIEHLETDGVFGNDGTDERAADYREKIESLKQSGRIDHYEFEERTESGRRVRHNTICAEDGSLLIYIEDITKGSRSREMAEIAFSIGNAGYWSTRFETGKYYLSETIRNLMTDEEVRDIQENGWWNRLHKEDLKATRAAWAKSFKTGEKMDFVYRLLSEKTGTRYFRNVGYPEFSTTGKPVGTTCFVMDVTEQKNTEIQLELAKISAENALSKSNAFLARMSHEIRTPMNGIMGMTQALLSSERGNEASEELHIIQRSAENLLRVLDDTLEMAKLKSEDTDHVVKPESPRQAISDAGRLWKQKAADNGTRLIVRVHNSVPESLIFDRSRFEQCLNNLLSNAVKFTENGEISVLSKLIQKDGQDMFVVAVKDTGIGMTTEQQKQVFLPFKQADETIKSRYGGTGLGMSITKNLVEMLGGTLQMRSVVGEGTVFLMSLPVAVQADEEPSSPTAQELADAARVIPAPQITREQAPTPQEAPPVSQAPNVSPASTLPQVSCADEARSGLSDISVLVAEDNDTNRMVVKALFEHVFGEIYFAENGQEAIKVLASRPIDIVLMDIHMPVMDGIEATLAIRNSEASYSNVPIIALTADPEFQQRRVCMNIGMDDARSKPVNREDLIESCLKVLAQRAEDAGLSLQSLSA